MSTPSKVSFIDVVTTDPSKIIYDFLRQYDRTMLAATCKSCLDAFILFLEQLPKDAQQTAKSFALRQFILRPNGDDYYPMSYLHALKKINAKLHPPSSPEFVGKLRKALYEEDRITMRILIDFGTDASKVLNDVLRKNFFIQKDIVKIILCSPKININGAVYRGYPLLVAAIFLDKFPIWEVLMNEENVSWDYADKLSRNLAFWASCCHTQNKFSFLKVCQTKNVKMDQKDYLGNNAAKIAVKHRNLDVLKYLIEECKTDVDSPNINGNTLAHESCERGFPKILEYLIEKGANLQLQNKMGDSALDFARMYHYKPLIQVLANKGVDLESKT